MKDNLISIIIPTFNAEKTIARCLDSILNQTYKQLEIIIINDGSKDKTQSILEFYSKKDKRINIINKKNTGVSDTRNIGLEKAKGHYLMFIDADDYLALNAIEELYNLAKEYDTDIIRYNGYIENSIGKFKKIEFPIPNKEIYFSEDIFKIIDIINNPKISIRCYSPLLFMRNKNIIKFKTKVSYLEDKIFYLDNFLNNKKILFVDKPLYYYTYNIFSKTKNTEDYYKKILDILESKKYIKDKVQKFSYNTDIIEESYCILILYRLDYYIQNIKYKDCKELLNKITNLLEKNKVSTKNFNNVKKIQYKLLLTKHYMSYYIISKIKNKISNLLK